MFSSKLRVVHARDESSPACQVCPWASGGVMDSTAEIGKGAATGRWFQASFCDSRRSRLKERFHA